MSDKPGFIDFVVADLLSGNEPPPAWQMVAAVLLIVLVWGALEYGLGRLLGRIIGAIKARWGNPPDRS
ncbi:hypothetical protein [Erythrobacter oryzae]|uniref:hypothetical protein n=1 Tax=Erythrobacter oryzae TaxID=3019556 RepID=UPI00255506A4|nr:hypothetical protein [Erythrobacter sp. COR-2]